MCSRLDAERDVLMQKFDIDADAALAAEAKWGEVFPTDPVLLIGYDREPAIRRWGIRPDWAERPIINARAEEAAAKKTFQPLLQNRCIVPATGYYEWRNDAGRKVKTRIVADGVLPIAGLMTDGAFVLFTCRPSAAISHIHDRMPAVLADDAVDDWLNPDFDFADVRPLLAPSDRRLAFSEIEPRSRPRPEARQASLF